MRFWKCSLINPAEFGTVKTHIPGYPNKGKWGGSVTILTRAKLKFKNIPDFWKHVRPVNTSLGNS